MLLPSDHPFYRNPPPQLFGFATPVRVTETGAALEAGLDFSTSTGLTLNSFGIAQANDNTGNGRNAVQSTASNQPIWNDNQTVVHQVPRTGGSAPSTLPNDWATDNTDGVTLTVEGVGETDGVPWVDIRLVGTKTGTNILNIFFARTPTDSLFAGDTFDSTAQFAVVGGNLTNIATVNFSTRIATNSSNINDNSPANNIEGSLTSSLQQFTSNAHSPTNSTMRRARQRISLVFNAIPAAIDVTFRIAPMTIRRNPTPKFNSRPYAFFDNAASTNMTFDDGVTPNLTTLGNASLDPSGATPWSVFFVGARNTDSAANFVAKSATTNVSTRMFTNATNQRPSVNLRGTELSNAALNVAQNAPFISGIVYDGSTATFYEDGVAYSATIGAATLSTNAIRLGAREDDSSAITNALTGSISEVYFFNGVPTAYQRERIEGALAWRYNLVGALPSNHPYKNAQPLKVRFS